MITLTSYGAAEEVTGSKHLVEVNGTRILLDCGLFQGHREEARRKNASFPFTPASIHACINSHGHLDHCGSYPTLVHKGFGGHILSTPATRDIASLVMKDSAHIQAYDARFLERQHQKHPKKGRKVFHPLYTESDVEDALSQYVTVAYHRPYRLLPGVTATLYDAGHILGSALVHLDIETENGRFSLGFTGDLGRPDKPIIRDPEPLPPLDWLVCESTYGDRLHDETSQAEEELAEVVRETAGRGGRIIIPAFAIERTQELVYLLHKLHDQGRLPPLPVFVDSPMAASATGIFRAHEECYDRETVRRFLDNGESPFSFDRLQYVPTAEASKRLNDFKEPCIIIATSGMCEAGRVLHHLVHSIEDSRNTVLIVGFMAANTLGRALADRRDEVRIFGDRHPRRARVKILNAFSAHADYREIGHYVTSLDRDRLKGISLVHGEPSAQEHLRGHLASLGLPTPGILAAGSPVTLKA